MPGYLLHLGATVLCLHGGSAQPATTYPRVMVSGQPVVVQSSIYTIAGCPLPPPIAGNGPCATATWLTAATRVRAGGIPVVLQDSQALCVLPATGLNVLSTQMRTRGT
jgi:hypothetical protein